MIGYENRHLICSYLDWDPAQDEVIELFRATQDCEIKSAYAIKTNTLAADGTNWFALNLLNGGTIGTATTAISGTIGGTAGLVGLTPLDFEVSDGTLTAGQIVVLNYNENGSGSITAMLVQLEILTGIGADS